MRSSFFYFTAVIIATTGANSVLQAILFSVKALLVYNDNQISTRHKCSDSNSEEKRNNIKDIEIKTVNQNQELIISQHYSQTPNILNIISQNGQNFINGLSADTDNIKKNRNNTYSTNSSISSYITIPSWIYSKQNIKNCKSIDFSWSNISQKWKDRAAASDTLLCIRRHPDNGDCLFRALTFALKFANIYKDNNLNYNIQDLRNIVASGFTGLLWSDVKNEIIIPDNWNYTHFLNYLTIFSAIESSGEFYDQWSPLSILKNNQYKASDGYFYPSSTNLEKAICVFNELRRCGNTHWGGDIDVAMIEKNLNISIILLNSNSGQIYCHGSINKKTDYYVLLHYQDSIHFELAGIFVETPNPPYKIIKSVFTYKELPEFIKDCYYDDCKQSLLSKEH